MSDQPEGDQEAKPATFASLLMGVSKVRRRALMREIEDNGFQIRLDIQTDRITAWYDVLTDEIRLIEDPPPP